MCFMLLCQIYFMNEFFRKGAALTTVVLLKMNSSTGIFKDFVERFIITRKLVWFNFSVRNSARIIVWIVYAEYHF